MGEKKFTLLELHLDGDTQFGPRSLSDALPIDAGGSADASSDSTDAAETHADEEADSSGGGRAIGVVVALVVLVGIALAVRKFKSGADEEFDAVEEPDVVVN